MRYSQAEKMEIIQIVEASELGVKRTLAEAWYQQEHVLRMVSPICGRWIRWSGATFSRSPAVLERDPSVGETQGGGDGFRASR